MVIMKIHIFKQIGDACGSYATPILYAFTADKVLAKAFKETRDMNNFIYKVINVDKLEYNQFVNTYPKKALIRTSFHTKNEYGEDEKIPLVVTFSEEEQTILRPDMVYEEISRYTRYDALLMNDDIREALMYINYFDIMSFYNNIEFESHDSLVRKLRGFGNSIDEFNVFMFFFGYLMNSE